MIRNVALLTMSLAACAASTAAPPPAAAPPIAVTTAQVRRIDRARPIVATGVLSAKAEVKASFKIGGLIASLTVDEGARVKRGQVLGALQATEIDAGVEQARQAVHKAERDLARAKVLLEGKAATREQVDDATTGVEVARAQLRAAQFNRDHAVIRAPADGRVLRRLAEAGELVAPGQPIFLLSGDGWVVRAGLADRDIVRVHDHDPASLTFGAWPDRPLTAHVSELASAATPPVMTYEVELVPDTVPDGDGRELRAGMIATVRIAPAGPAPATLVPALALRDGDGRRAVVWSPDGKGGVVRHPVEIAFFDGPDVAIAAGLDGVAAVVTEGAAYLTEHAQIAVVPASNGAAR
jgi:RND family efflux transporter MFP subunit